MCDRKRVGSKKKKNEWAATHSAKHTYPPARQNQQFIDTYGQFAVDQGTTVSLYIDAAYTVACYDGTSNATATQNGGLIPPIGMSLRYGMNASDRGPGRPFDFTVPSFGFLAWQLPVFVRVAEAGTAPAIGEAYAFCTNASALPTIGGPAIDWSVLSIATFTWAAGQVAGAALLDVRVRGATASGTPYLYEPFGVDGGMWSFSTPGGGMWGWNNGGLRFGTYTFNTIMQFSNFTRTADYTTVRTVSMTDGPDCAQRLALQNGTNPHCPTCRPPGCLGSPVLFSYVQLPRSLSS